MMRGTLAGFALTLLLVVAAGCGDSSRAAVSGEVTLDGESVDGGTISFVPSDASAGPPAWGEINAGRYEIPASEGPAVGNCRIEIRWNRKTGRNLPAEAPAPQGSVIEETIEAMPPRFNTKSELSKDIQPGDNSIDFSLQLQVQ